MENRASKNTERRKRILEAASRLIVQYGFDKTTMDDIAREAHVSKGALYLHWPSKDSLFSALIWAKSWEFIDDWHAALMADPDGGKLSAMIKYTLVLLRKSPILNALYTRDLRIVGDYLLRDQPKIPEMRYFIGKDFFQTMQQAGLVRPDVDPELAAYALSAIAYGLTKVDEVIPKETAPPMDKTLEFVYDMVDRYLAPPGGGDSETGKRLITSIIGTFRQLTTTPAENASD